MNLNIKSAIFFDRDGSLIVDKPYQYKASEIEYLPGYFELMEFLTTQSHFLKFIVTNQSGVARGFFKDSSIREIHKRMNLDLKSRSFLPFDDLAFCPHIEEDQCSCRKPKAGMIEELCSKWNVDRQRSLMIGDRLSDMGAGHNAKLGHLVLLNDRNLEKKDADILKINLTSISNLFELVDYLSSL